MNPKNTLKKKKLRNKKIVWKKRSIKGGMLSSALKRLSSTASDTLGSVSEGFTQISDVQALFKEIAPEMFKTIIDKYKSSFFEKLSLLNSIPGLKYVSSSFYSILELMMTNLPLIDLESSKQMIMNIKKQLGNEPVKFNTYLENRLRMFSYNPKRVTQDYFESNTDLRIEKTFDDDDQNALIFTILSYNFEKILSPEEKKKDDNNTVFDILTYSCEQEKTKQKLWYTVPNFNSKILKDVKSIEIGLNFGDIIEFESNGGQLLIKREQSTETTVSEKDFNYRKNIMNSDKKKKISKFFIFKLTFNENKKKQTVIAIRGTQSFTDVSIDLDYSTATLKDVLSESEESEESVFTFDDLLLNCSFHKGFLESTLTIFKKIYKNYLSQLRSEEDILICGHSMGGAEAAILGLLIKFCKKLQGNTQIKGNTQINLSLGNIKIITFNPGTYILRNDDYDLMNRILMPFKERGYFDNRIYRSAGDLISVCSLENISQTASILSEPNFIKEQLIQNFTSKMEEKRLSERYTDLLDIQYSPKSTSEKSSSSSDVITMWDNNTEKFYFKGNYKVPFLITGRESVEAHSLSNFKNLILDSDQIYEKSVDKTVVDETMDSKTTPLDFISQMIALRTKVMGILKSGELPKSFESFLDHIKTKLPNEKIMEIIKKIHERADGFFKLNLSFFPKEEKELTEGIFKSLSKDGFSKVIKAKENSLDLKEFFKMAETKFSASGGNSSRKKRKGRILRKSTFKRNIKQKGGSPEGIVLGILQIYLGFLFCPMLTSLFLISCGPMICMFLMASF